MGDTVQLSCQTSLSNPPAQISWSLNGHPVENSTFTTLASQNGGWISSSNISIKIDSNSRIFVAACNALNTKLKEHAVGSHRIHVLCKYLDSLRRLQPQLLRYCVVFVDPPSQPLLTGYNEGDVITSGSVKKLHCISTGGNPPPTMTWYKNGRKLNTISKVQDAKVISELTILVNASDNNAIYNCEIQSPALEIPLFTSKILSVNCKLFQIIQKGKERY